MKRTRYKFSHRAPGLDGKDRYWWWGPPLANDSRRELVSIRCWEFWSPPICGSRGPRIGEDGQPVCKRVTGHKGLHAAPESDGWGPHMKWGLALHSRPGYFL